MPPNLLHVSIHQPAAHVTAERIYWHPRLLEFRRMHVSLRIGFHYHIPMYVDLDGRLRTPGYLGRFLESLGAHCESLTCFLHSPRADEIAQMDYVIESRNVRWVDIGPHASVPKRMLCNRQFSRPVKEHRRALDALLIRGPSPLLPAMANGAGDLPVALLIVGDYLAGINDLPQPRWRKEAIRLWSYWNFHRQMAVARNSLTFVNSHKLYEEMRAHVPQLYETRTATLNADDFFERGDTCQAWPVRLLYTGRMDRTKGLLEMVEAVALLVRQGVDVVLDLVGWPQKGDRVLEELTARACACGISERLVYHGYKAVGPELFAYYRQADIYVIASQSSEGFPRTIWEAMAHSLPVVATNVGAIPLFLENNCSALLVEPMNSQALAQAIRQVIIDSSLRSALINNGFKLARSNTLQARASEMIERITAWLETQ